MFKDRFKDQIALVTGGASGIGKAVAQRLLSEGSTVVIADYNEEALEQALADLRPLGGVTGVKLDISNEDDVKEKLESLVFEQGQLDVVFNSAGIIGKTSTSITDYDSSIYEQVYKVNQLGSFLILKYAIQHMLHRNYGRILLMASIAGKDGNPGMAAYTSTKAAVIGLVKGVGKEFAETGITINGLAPAVISTPMNLETDPAMLKYMVDKIPMKRLGTIEETAAIACWILSKEASFNTAAVFDLSGGRAVY